MVPYTIITWPYSVQNIFSYLGGQFPLLGFLVWEREICTQLDQV
jgi:hypothetical protein